MTDRRPGRLDVRVVKRLDAFTLDVAWQAGDEVVALFGPSGAGKTQTLPLSIYTAVQTGEAGQALALVGVLTLLSCAVVVASARLGARPL